MYKRPLVARARALRVGPGAAAGVDMGALANAEQLQRFTDYVRIGTDEGATLGCGGDTVTVAGSPGGFFVRSAVFSDAEPHMRIVTDEVFGPLLAFQRAGSLDEAIDLANATEFGLSAAIVTGDLAVAQRFARTSRSGLVKLNQPTAGTVSYTLLTLPTTLP